MSFTAVLSATGSSSITDAVHLDTDRVVTVAGTSVVTHDLLAGTSSTNGTFGASRPSICLISAGVCALGFSSSTTVALMELATGYTQTYAISSFTLPYSEGIQQSASISGSNSAYCITTTAGTLAKFDIATYTASLVTIPLIGANAHPTCIVAGASSYYIGTSTGLIIEADEDLNIIGSMQLGIERLDYNERSTSMIARPVQCLIHENNFILASAGHGVIFKVYWPNKSILEVQPAAAPFTSSTRGGLVFSASEDMQIVAATYSTVDDNVICYVNWGVTPIDIVDTAYIDSVGSKRIIAIVRTDTYFYVVIGGTSALKLTYTPITVTYKTLSIYDGEYKSGRVILIYDPGVVDVAYIYADIEVNSSGTQTYPIQNVLDDDIIAIGMYGNGVAKKFGVGNLPVL